MNGPVRRWGSMVAVLLAVAAAAGTTGRAAELPRARAEDLGFSAARLDDIDRFCNDSIQRGQLAGTVTLVARHGKVVHFSALGFADVEKRTALQTDSIFRFYSMTKPITSAALMMLYEEGRFQLSDPLSKYLPEFSGLRVLRNPDGDVHDTVPVTHEPTIQDIMRHTAGFTHGLEPTAFDAEYTKANLFGLDVSLAGMTQKLGHLPLRYQPGTKWEYSVGPDVQARLVEVLSGMPFERFLEKRMFEPLHMQDAGFWVPPAKAPRLAAVHYLKNGKLTPIDKAHGSPGDLWLSEPWTVNSYTEKHTRTGGSYGLAGTAEDYFRFAQMMLNGGELDGMRLLSPKTVAFMVRDHLGTIEFPGPEGKPSGLGFGLGFAVVQDPGAAGFLSSVGSYFWAGYAATHFWVDPKEDLVIVVLTQHVDVPAAETVWTGVRNMVYAAMVH